MKNLAPITDPITLCRDITSYNVARGWSAAMFMYIKIPSMIANLPLLPKTLDPCTSPRDIVNLAEDADLDSYISEGTNNSPSGQESSISWNPADVTQYFSHPRSSRTLVQLPLQDNIKNGTGNSSRIQRWKQLTGSSHHDWNRYWPITGISTYYKYHHCPSRPRTRLAAGNITVM